MNKPIRPATDILLELGKGRVVADLTQAIHEATQAVNVHNKPATVTLTIKIEQYKKDSMLAEMPLLLSGEVETKLPKPAPEHTLYYPDDDGNITRTPQRQQGLDLQIGQRSTNED